MQKQYIFQRKVISDPRKLLHFSRASAEVVSKLVMMHLGEKGLNSHAPSSRLFANEEHLKIRIREQNQRLFFCSCLVFDCLPPLPVVSFFDTSF